MPFKYVPSPNFEVVCECGGIHLSAALEILTKLMMVTLFFLVCLRTTFKFQPTLIAFSGSYIYSVEILHPRMSEMCDVFFMTTTTTEAPLIIFHI